MEEGIDGGPRCPFEACRLDRRAQIAQIIHRRGMRRHAIGGRRHRRGRRYPDSLGEGHSQAADPGQPGTHLLVSRLPRFGRGMAPHGLENPQILEPVSHRRSCETPKGSFCHLTGCKAAALDVVGFEPEVLSQVISERDQGLDILNTVLRHRPACLVIDVRPGTDLLVQCS